AVVHDRERAQERIVHLGGALVGTSSSGCADRRTAGSATTRVSLPTAARVHAAHPAAPTAHPAAAHASSAAASHTTPRRAQPCAGMLRGMLLTIELFEACREVVVDLLELRRLIRGEM